MTGTYVSQQHFDDINACMDYMRKADVAVWDFTQLLGLVAQWPAFRPVAEIQEGARQASAWNINSNKNYHMNVAELLAEVIRFADYIVASAVSLTAADNRRGLDIFQQIAPPPGLELKYAPETLTDCTQILRHYRRLMWAKAQVGQLAAPTHENLRQGISTSLPRVADFMSFYLRRAVMNGGQGPESNAARQLAENVDRLYVFGMVGMANFLTQTQRITDLITNASDRFAALENTKSIQIVVTDMKLIKRDLTDAQRYCEDMAALGARS